MPFIPPFGSPPGGAAGATIELDNLGTVAINTSLISDTDSTDDLGSPSIAWANLFVDSITIPTAQSATDVTITPYGPSQVRNQGIRIDNASGYAFLRLGGSSANDGGQLHFDNTNNGAIGNITGFQDDLTIVVSGSGGVLTLTVWTASIYFKTSGQDRFAPLADSAIDLGSTSQFWNKIYTDEVALTNVGAAAAAADKLVLSAIDLSAGNTILDINTEGTDVVGSGTPTADRTVAIRVNGTVLYLIASTAAS